MTNSVASISGAAWTQVLIGLAASTFMGFFGGFLIVKLVVFLFKNVSRKKSNIAFSYAQMTSAVLMVFNHGAQDGQKFMGVLCLRLFWGPPASAFRSGSTGAYERGRLTLPIWVMILCSLIMAVGTSIGGYKIIKKMGMEMVKLEKYQGFRLNLPHRSACSS